MTFPLPTQRRGSLVPRALLAYRPGEVVDLSVLFILIGRSFVPTSHYCTRKPAGAGGGPYN